MPPYVLTPAMCSDTPHAPICSNNPCMSPMLPCASACDWGMCRSYLCLDTSPCVPTPLTVICSPACLCSRGYCMHCGGNIPYVGGLGASAHLSGFWCLSVYPLDVHYASFCIFLVFHYVSSLYFHCYDYYSSSDSGLFWYVISTISDHGSLFDGASYNVGSAWCGYPKGFGGVLGHTSGHSSNLHFWCLFRPVPVIPWVLHR